ncbi:matrixin family metalloprotease [Gammaproteobacteria bacterium]|nr:matrixin family metalloprotease [Gammaproteobacteria bacterium]
MMNKICMHILAGVFGIIAQYSLSFEIDGSKWIGGETDFYVDISGISRTGILWNTAFAQAAQEWNSTTVFNFNLIRSSLDACSNDGLNGIIFSDEICGQDFGISDVAVTVQRLERQLLGPPALIEADIFVKEKLDFDIFDGENLLRGPYPERIDFKRSMLHELGHVIGLNHEMINPAIMQPKYGDIYKLQRDDILGVNTLYGGLSNCAIQPLRLGLVQGQLTYPDCTVKNLTLGGEDESLIDIYKFSVAELTNFIFSATSSDVEPVLIIADSELNYLAQDSNITGGCEANLQLSLGPGDYFLIFNTFDRQVKENCGLEGNYQLSSYYSGPSFQQLGPSVSLRGSPSTATFTGNISANNGATFGNKFTPQESLDISVSIAVDKNHWGREGFIIVAAMVGDEILLLNDEGVFINSRTTSGELISHSEKNLDSLEIIQIGNNIVPAEIDIKQVTVDFFVGYGLFSKPNEIYFHDTPLNLIISPKIDLVAVK